MNALPKGLESLASCQHGVVSREQALVHLTPGRLRWLLTSGRWQAVHPGVYQTHTGPLVWPARAMAAVLLAEPRPESEPRAAVGLHGAGYLHGFLRVEPAIIPVAMHNPITIMRRRGVRIFRPRRFTTTRVGGVPVTSGALTVIQLSALSGVGHRDAIAYAADAVRVGACTVDDLVAELTLRARHPHRRLLALALGDIAVGAESTLEVGFLDRVIRPHGLPVPHLQRPASTNGASIRRDAEWTAYGVICEIDGRIGHEGSGIFRDRRRDRSAAANGKVTVRAGWADVYHEACELAADLHSTLSHRGLTDPFRGCGSGCLADLRHTS